VRHAGVNRGDRSGFSASTTGISRALARAASLGALFVPLNFRLTGPELGASSTTRGVHALIADGACRGDRRGAHPAVLPPLPRHDDVAPSWRALDEFAANAQPLAEAERVVDDVAIIMYTSGTTGRPKGAMRPRQFLLENVSALRPGKQAADVTLTCAAVPTAGSMSRRLLPAGRRPCAQRSFEPTRCCATSRPTACR
jgi:fatty-acyl-CoA synthase